MTELENIRDWRGQDVVDPENEKIGKLEDVYFDVDDGSPTFAAVKTGLFGRKLAFVPLQSASAGRDHVRVAYKKADVKDGPTIEPGAELSEHDEAALFGHYGLQYTPASAGRRLARR